MPILLNKDVDPVSFSPLGDELHSLLTDPVMPVPAYGVFAYKNDRLIFEKCEGLYHFDLDAPLSFTADTRFRTASISKVFTVLGIMRLREKGLLDMDEDISSYLGFSLRNPHYPDSKITLKMLMSHTSSIRDGSMYSIAPDYSIREFFVSEGVFYKNGEHFAFSADGIDRSPGTYFTYCNLNYGILGTIIERISHLRFDEYMKKEVLLPLGLGASYNVGDFSQEELNHLSPLYRSIQADKWDASQPWAAQIDEYNGDRPNRNQVLITNPDLVDENVPADMTGYHVGNNGTLYSPQGGLRISLNEMKVLAELFLNDGKINGSSFLTKESIDLMFTPVWNYDPETNNGNTLDGLMTCFGCGIQTMTSKDRDRFVIDRNILLSGHFGEAYGLLAGLFVDREKKNAIFYMINGQGDDHDRHHGKYSGMYEWEERLCTALLDHLFPEL